MKKALIISLVLTLAVGLGTAFAKPEGTPDANRLFKFNIIGMQNPKNVNMDQGSGKVIFVNLEGKSEINLVCSDEQGVLDTYPDLEEGSFDILDKNATDRGGAVLALPDPGLDPYIIGTTTEMWSDYSIYIRSLGKPGGWANITTCAEVDEAGISDWLVKDYIKIWNRVSKAGFYASIEQVGRAITERPKGKSIFTNVTAELLTIVLEIGIYEEEYQPGDVAIDYVYVRIPIFDQLLQNEYWEYDNNGLKLLQVWIYDNRTNVAEDDETNYPDEF